MKMKLSNAITEYEEQMAFQADILHEIGFALAAMQRVSIPEVYRAIARLIGSFANYNRENDQKWLAVAEGLQQRADQMPELKQVALPLDGIFKFYPWQVERVFGKFLGLYQHMITRQKADFDGDKGILTTGEMVKIIKQLLLEFAAGGSTRKYVQAAGIYEILGDAVKDLQTIQDALGEKDLDVMHEGGGNSDAFSWG